MTPAQKQKLERIKDDLRRVAALDSNPADDDICEMTRIANEDVTALLKRQTQSDNAMDRRAFVRCVFASVESMLFGMKQMMVKCHKDLTIAELALLREQSYELNDSGEARIKSARISLKSNLRFTFRTWAKLIGTTSKLDLTDHGWQSFQAAIKVRDRLMHPKKASDLAVSDEEIKVATTAYFWFYTAYTLSLSQVAIITIRHMKATGEWDALTPTTEKKNGNTPDSDDNTTVA